MKRPLLIPLLAAAFAAPLATGAAQTARPNILFIITDQQFADAMSCRMGKEFINTPAMDHLARTGTLFTRAYSSNPLCMPWRNSVFTGRYPHETRVTANANPPGGLDPEEFVSLGNYFRNAGYDAAYSGKWHLCFNTRDTAAHGFEFVTGKVAVNHDAGVANGAVKFLARHHDKPFVLVASFMNPHNICEWARRIAGREQTLNCGEIGMPPPPDQLPPLPANFAPPANEPDAMTLMPLALGQTVAAWREYVVVENNMTQAGEVDGLRPEIQGRMVRTDRFKYCVFSHGRQLESLIDMQADPGEMTSLLTDPRFHEVLLQHRALLARFGKEHDDALATTLLSDNVKPVPFTDSGPV